VGPTETAILWLAVKVRVGGSFMDAREQCDDEVLARLVRSNVDQLFHFVGRDGDTRVEEGEMYLWTPGVHPGFYGMPLCVQVPDSEVWILFDLLVVVGPHEEGRVLVTTWERIDDCPNPSVT
jgi:hypothetical protein